MTRPGISHLTVGILALSLGLAAEARSQSAVRVEGPAVVKARTAALLVSDMSGGDLRTQVLALPWVSTPTPGSDAPEDRTPVLVRVEIDGQGLLRTVDTGPLEVFLYALEDDDEVLDAFTVRLQIDPSLDREALARGGLALTASLDLPDGTHRIRHLAWSDSQLFGLGTTEVTVSSEDPAPVAWIAERPEHWLQVPLVDPGWLGGGAAGEREGGDLWPRPAGLPLLPTAEGSAEEGAGASAVGSESPEVEMWWRIPGSVIPGAGAARLVAAEGADGEPEAAVHRPFQVLERRSSTHGATLLRVAFPTPRLAPGRYLLSLHPENGAPTAPVPVLVTDPGTAGVWTRVLSGDEPEEPPAEAPPPEPARPTRSTARALPDEDAFRRQAEEGYRRVVGLLAAAGPSEEAADELARLEAELLDKVGSEGLDQALALLTAVQRQAPESMLGFRAEGVPALALLHRDAARRHARNGRWSLVDHGAEQASWLAEWYAIVVDTAQAWQDGARLVAGLGVDLRAAGRSRQAVAMFRRSLTMGDTDAALLGLAALLERSGRPSDAVPPLERLLGRRPDHREGRLRLAVNLARLGRDKAARDHLQRLVRSPDRSWMTAVAFQELARLELAAGTCLRAVRILRNARELFPDQPQLAVQMAWALECAGERAAARALAGQVVERARRGETSPECPRMLYTRWNEDALAGDRERLGELARQARQALARDLGGLEEGP